MSNLSKPLCSLRHGISSQFQLLQHFDYGVRAVFKGVNCLLFLLSLVVFILPKNSFGQCNILGTPLTITGAVTWNTSNTIYTNVIVSAGATLTISGSGTLIRSVLMRKFL